MVSSQKLRGRNEPSEEHSDTGAPVSFSFDTTSSRRSNKGSGVLSSLKAELQVTIRLRKEHLGSTVNKAPVVICAENLPSYVSSSVSR